MLDSLARIARLEQSLDRWLPKPRRQEQGRPTSDDWTTLARPEQLPPDLVLPWVIWLVLAGRGWGKTRTGGEWADGKARELPGSRLALVAPTAADVRDVMVEGESGIVTKHPDVLYEPSKRRLTWPNGSMATLYSADEPNRLRGPQHHHAWADEIAAWRYPDAWDMLMMGLRLGERPQCVATTTPRQCRHLRALLEQHKGGTGRVVVTRGSTYDNLHNLAPTFRDQVLATYEGTRLGRQELYAELLEDAAGALWRRADLDLHRVTVAPQLRRVVVGIDPAVSSSVTSDETGIIVAGLGHDGHGYVLDDRSGRFTPADWAARAAKARADHGAERVIAEANQGGAMVELTLRTADKQMPIRLVHASRGKRARAEPIAALYEQGRIHHVGSLAMLEDQLCSWEATDQASPDRLDALVWALTDLMGGPPPASYSAGATHRVNLPQRRI